jgi:hypothetical protein
MKLAPSHHHPISYHNHNSYLSFTSLRLSARYSREKKRSVVNSSHEKKAFTFLFIFIQWPAHFGTGDQGTSLNGMI